MAAFLASRGLLDNKRHAVQEKDWKGKQAREGPLRWTALTLKIVPSMYILKYLRENLFVGIRHKVMIPSSACNSVCRFKTVF